MREAFQIPGFARLYAALTASALGDSVLLLVLSMWVKTLTGSNGQAGLTLAGAAHSTYWLRGHIRGDLSRSATADALD